MAFSEYINSTWKLWRRSKKIFYVHDTSEIWHIIIGNGYLHFSLTTLRLIWENFVQKLFETNLNFIFTTNKKSEMILSILLYQLVRLTWQKCLYFVWFVTTNLKLRFVSNTLWPKISKSSHCEQSPQLNDGNAVHLSRYLEINRFIGMTWTHSCSRKPYEQ